jgi:orotate phosphoribosyltransferase
MSWDNRKPVLKKELCDVLIRIGALQFGSFTLSSGKLSPYYIDLRIVPSYPKVFQKVMKVYIETAKNDIDPEKFRRVAGIPTAGLPFASVLAYSLSKPLIYVRKEAKTHGRERRVEGILQSGDQVLLVDDLVTTGGSLIDAADAVRAEGGVVENALVLLDREEGGRRNLKNKGIALNCLATMSEISKMLYDVRTISEEQLKDILKQIEE